MYVVNVIILLCTCTIQRKTHIKLYLHVRVYAFTGFFSYNTLHIIICLPAIFRVGTYQTPYVCPTQNTPLCGFFFLVKRDDFYNLDLYIICGYAYFNSRFIVLMCY